MGGPFGIPMLDKVYNEVISKPRPDNWKGPDTLEGLLRRKTVSIPRYHFPPIRPCTFEMDGKDHLSFGIPWEDMSDAWKNSYKEGRFVVPPKTVGEIALEKIVQSIEARNVYLENIANGTSVEKSGEEELEVASSESKEGEVDKRSDTDKTPNLESKQDVHPLMTCAARSSKLLI